MMCGGVAAYHRYGVCTVGCVECGMVCVLLVVLSAVWCVYWQHVIGMVCVLLVVLGAVWCVYWQHVIRMVCVL